MSRVDNKYISHAIDELISLLGIKEHIPTGIILKPLRSGKVKESVEKIADYLGLPIVVNLSFSDKFETRSLATTDYSGRGVEGITAQVSIPGHLPFYGTSGLKNFPIRIKISDNCQRYPETFMAIMAHELSHILLHSLMHKEKDNEFYTDLTAMILGFSNVLRGGRKVVETEEYYASIETTTTTYGYLSDEQFNFAFNKIDKILKKSIDSYNDLKGKALQKLTTYRKQLSSYKKQLFRFNRFMECLDKNQNKRIGKEDAVKIVVFHQPDYDAKFTVALRSNEEKFKEINDFCVGLLKNTRHYGQQRLNALQVFHEKIDTLISDLKKESDLLNNDVNTLKKYIGFIPKLKINRQATLYEKLSKSAP